jgi:hypothetical protein
MKLWTATLYLLARWEVSNARFPNAEGNGCEDLLPPGLIPSVTSSWRDRVLAEIDQDGFIFAVEEPDTQFFNTKKTMAPRRHHRVQIVLTEVGVCVRKSVLRKNLTGIFARFREFIQFEFYLEAAALLRLRGLAGVPAIRRLDPSKGIIEMDYIWGSDLRQLFAGGRHGIEYEDVSRQFAALIAKADNELSRQIVELLGGVVSRGVIPRDLNAANFIRATRSGKVYLIDYNLVYLRPIPGWRSHARNLTSMLGTCIEPPPLP